MNRGHVLQSSPVQQMMAGTTPTWPWNMNNMRSSPPPSHQASSFLGSPSLLIPNSQFIPTSSSSTLPLSSSSSSWAAATADADADADDHHNQELPESWSQLLLGGLVSSEEEQKSGMQATKKLENWEEQLLQQQQQQQNHNNMYGHGHENPEFHWSQMIPVSSPTSCVTTLSSTNMLDFSANNKSSPSDHGRHPVLPDPSVSECNSTATLGGVAKKPRVQPSSTQSSFKVRKEKLGDRITALHQLVSPFGKTDTASVLLEAIGYIRFLQSQIEALSLPYLSTSKSGNARQQQQHHVQGGVVERNCLFPEDPGQLLNNENCMKRKAMSDQECEEEEPKKDLRSRGLCLVPISCTLQVGSDNGADYWAPALGGGFR